MRQYPDRLIGVASVDLHHPMAAVRELRRCVRELGFRALRILPWLWELPPDDRRYYPLYAECIELGVPFCLRSATPGRCIPPSRADRFPISTASRSTSPSSTIVAGHIGWPWTSEMIALATKYPNVYIDTSAYTVAALSGGAGRLPARPRPAEGALRLESPGLAGRALSRRLRCSSTSMPRRPSSFSSGTPSGSSRSPRTGRLPRITHHALRRDKFDFSPRIEPFFGGQARERCARPIVRALAPSEPASPCRSPDEEEPHMKPSVRVVAALCLVALSVVPVRAATPFTALRERPGAAARAVAGRRAAVRGQHAGQPPRDLRRRRRRPDPRRRRCRSASSRSRSRPAPTPRSGW